MTSRRCFSGKLSIWFLLTTSPLRAYRLAFGTSLFRVDLVDANIKIVTTLNTRGEEKLKRSLSPMFTFPHPTNDGTFAQVKILGALTELDFVPRNNEVQSYEPCFSLGLVLINQYRILLETHSPPLLLPRRSLTEPTYQMDNSGSSFVH